MKIQLCQELIHFNKLYYNNNHLQKHFFFFTIDLGNVPDYIPRYLYLKYTEYYSPNNFEEDNIFKIISFQQSQFITHSAILAPYMSVAIEE